MNNSDIGRSTIKYTTKFWVFVLLFVKVASAQVFVSADGTTDPYKILNNKGWYEEETSLHPGVKHLTQQWDVALNKYVFSFAMHKDMDGDRDERIDRQRLEIKTFGKSPANMKAAQGETHYYRWKFKLDEEFQPSPNFCHIHQLKAGDGPDSGSPIMTITPRYGSPDKLQLIYVPSSGVSGGGTIKEVSLAPFRGEWIEAYEKVVYNDPGEYSLVLKRVEDDAVLFEYESKSLDLWREGSTFIRPKYGIYRSISKPEYLRDEQVLFADFSLTEGTVFKAPETPDHLTATLNENEKIVLEWKANSNNEDQFRIDISIDGGLTWRYLSTSLAGSAKLEVDKSVAASGSTFRVRAENAMGNSAFATSGVITGSNFIKNKEHTKLKSYPNPFSEKITVSYIIPEKSKVKLSVCNLSGNEIAVLTEGLSEQGNYLFNWSPSSLSGFTGGCYILKLQTDYSQECIQILKEN